MDNNNKAASAVKFTFTKRPLYFDKQLLLDCGDIFNQGDNDKIKCFTVACWFCSDAPHNNDGHNGNHLFGYGGGWSESGFSVFLYSHQNIRLEFQRRNNFKEIADFGLDKQLWGLLHSEWNHICLSFDMVESQFNLFFNGKQLAAKRKVIKTAGNNTGGTMFDETGQPHKFAFPHKNEKIPFYIGSDIAFPLAGESTNFNHIGCMYNAQLLNCMVNSEEEVSQLMISDVVNSYKQQNCSSSSIDKNDQQQQQAQKKQKSNSMKPSLASKHGILFFSMCEEDINPETGEIVNLAANSDYYYTSKDNKQQDKKQYETFKFKDFNTCVQQYRNPSNTTSKKSDKKSFLNNKKLIFNEETIPFKGKVSASVPPSAFVSEIASLYGEEQMADLTLELPYNPEVGNMKFKVHKCVLVARCPHFKSLLLTSGMIETRQANILLENVQASAASFRDFLKYLYTDQVQLDEENAVELLLLADESGVQRLKDLAEEYLTNMINSETVCALHTLPIQTQVLHMLTDMYLSQNAAMVEKRLKETDMESYNNYANLLKSYTGNSKQTVVQVAPADEKKKSRGCAQQ